MTASQVTAANRLLPPPAADIPRDLRFEDDWLQRVGKDPDFAPAVQARLSSACARGELREDHFAPRSLRAFLAELDEKALDIAGCGVLAMQLPAPPGASVQAVGLAHRFITQAAELAAAASSLARTAASYLPHQTDALA